MPKPGQVRRSSIAPTPAPKPVVTTPPARDDEPRYIPRVFESIVHLEQAIDHLKKVGITPKELVPTADVRRKMISDLEGQLKSYKDYWNNLPQHQ